MSVEVIKAVFVGYNGVGKTTLLAKLAGVAIPEPHCTVLDVQHMSVSYQETPLKLTLWDTYVQEEYDRLRPLNYPGTDVFVLCFSAVKPSYSSGTYLRGVVEMFWKDEIVRCGYGDVPLILLMTQTDKTEDSRTRTELLLVTKEEVDGAIKQAHPSCYLKVSSVRSQGMGELMEKVIELGYLHRQSVKDKEGRGGGRSKSCSLL